ncbi:helix-turn-helix domain-containing protein [Paenibacillus ehimensis]|uniref:Helix-turn-helix transcriptional regulator n=1 Tax=Paenibacillus ehimensis TaxID=79264 RepID=A0ABT8VHE6_9BACL|nr:helix-turn-helix transcriptional regulator [Paenibacillus ehimensis]MDO3680398.1 helix-turn-helix transcriptional regulator [Paenibacillus ehimensis]
MHRLGDKIKELRVNRGLSQDELAEKLNKNYGTTINKGMISKWENDLTEPKLETARILALFFNVTLDELIGLHNDIQTIAAHKEGEDWTEEELETIRKFKDFVRSQRKQG